MAGSTIYFEDVDLGDEIGPLERVARDQDVIDFCQLWGNPMPNRFTDQEKAEKTRLPGPILPGIMSMALMAQLLTDWASPESLNHLSGYFKRTGLVLHAVKGPIVVQVHYHLFATPPLR